MIGKDNIIKKYDFNNMEFIYHDDVFHPEITEKRELDSVRKTLLDPLSKGPNTLYSIAMDVGLNQDKERLQSSDLLLGICIYSSGTVGREPVRSQGHIHGISESCNYSTGELYEIWYGEAIIVMQESVTDDPGTVYIVEAKKNDVVLVPPGWAHYTVNKNPNDYMVFGAWCIRDYTFDYTDIRKRNGLSLYPIVEGDQVNFIQNAKYNKDFKIVRKNPRRYTEFNLDYTKSIYQQYSSNSNDFDFITNPKKYKNTFKTFKP